LGAKEGRGKKERGALTQGNTKKGEKKGLIASRGKIIWAILLQRGGLRSVLGEGSPSVLREKGGGCLSPQRHERQKPTTRIREKGTYYSSGREDQRRCTSAGELYRKKRAANATTREKPRSHLARKKDHYFPLKGIQPLTPYIKIRGKTWREKSFLEETSRLIFLKRKKKSRLQLKEERTCDGGGGVSGHLEKKRTTGPVRREKRWYDRKKKGGQRRKGGSAGEKKKKTSYLYRKQKGQSSKNQ